MFRRLIIAMTAMALVVIGFAPSALASSPKVTAGFAPGANVAVIISFDQNGNPSQAGEVYTNNGVQSCSSTNPCESFAIANGKVKLINRVTGDKVKWAYSSYEYTSADGQASYTHNYGGAPLPVCQTINGSYMCLDHVQAQLRNPNYPTPPRG